MEPNRNFVRAAGLCLLALTVSSQQASGQVVKSFSQEVTAHARGTLDVSETIILDSAEKPLAGFFRYLPSEYNRYGKQYAFDPTILQVTDDKGRSLHYEAAPDKSDLRMRIDAAVPATGISTFHLRYRVQNAITFRDRQPELYWNITGGRWPSPLRSVTCRLHLPPTVLALDLKPKTLCFIRPANSGLTASAAPGIIMVDGPDLVFSNFEVVPANNEMAFRANLPEGSAMAPSRFGAVSWFVRDWWQAFVVPLLTLLWVSHRVRQIRTGGKKTTGVALNWDPPEGLSPAEIGMLLDRHNDLPDVVSTLVDLSQRGYLKISERGTLADGNRDYAFTLQATSLRMKKLRRHEKLLMQAVFQDLGDDAAAPHPHPAGGNGSGTSPMTMLSHLQTHFYRAVPGIAGAALNRLSKRGYVEAHRYRTRRVYEMLAVVIGLVGFAAFVVVTRFNTSLGEIRSELLCPSFGFSALIVLIGSRFMTPRTQAGGAAVRQCYDYGRLVAHINRRRTTELSQEDPMAFSRVLPYAYVLGVASEWAAAFHDLMTTSPPWYEVNSAGLDLAGDRFLRDLAARLDAINAALMSGAAAVTPSLDPALG